MTNMDSNKIKKAMEQAKASIEIENIEIKTTYTELVRARLTNEITEEEFQKKVKEIISSNNDKDQE